MTISVLASLFFLGIMAGVIAGCIVGQNKWILNWKKIKRRIDNGELADCYWSDYHRALVFVFVKSPVVVRTRRKDIVKKWREQGLIWHE